MAFSATGWARASAHSNGNVPHVWCYKNTDDTSATIAGNEYFLAKYLELKVGDLAWTYGSDGGQLIEFITVSSTQVRVTVVDTD